MVFQLSHQNLVTDYTFNFKMVAMNENQLAKEFERKNHIILDVFG